MTRMTNSRFRIWYKMRYGQTRYDRSSLWSPRSFFPRGGSWASTARAARMRPCHGSLIFASSCFTFFGMTTRYGIAFVTFVGDYKSFPGKQFFQGRVLALCKLPFGFRYIFLEIREITKYLYCLLP